MISHADDLYWGAAKSLARPGGKQALTFARHSKNKNQKFVRPTESPRQQWPPRRTKNGDLSIVFFQSGRAKDLSALLFNRGQLYVHHPSLGQEWNGVGFGWLQTTFNKARRRYNEVRNVGTPILRMLIQTIYVLLYLLTYSKKHSLS
jgi:hypothetical protein